METVLTPRINQIIEANTYAKNNIHSTTEIINSAIDGRVYKKYISEKNDQNLDISFNLNTDGAQVVNSRKYKMWPLLGTIVELNQSSRESYKNMIFFGM